MRDIDVVSDRCIESPVFDFAPDLAGDAVLLPAPGTADGDIKQQVQGVVERPLAEVGVLFFSGSGGWWDHSTGPKLLLSSAVWKS